MGIIMRKMSKMIITDKMEQEQQEMGDVYNSEDY